jgi:hypothetical protein
MMALDSLTLAADIRDRLALAGIIRRDTADAIDAAAWRADRLAETAEARAERAAIAEWLAATAAEAMR